MYPSIYPSKIPQELESQLGVLVEAAAGAVKALGNVSMEGHPTIALCHAEANGVKNASAVGVARGPGDEHSGDNDEE